MSNDTRKSNIYNINYPKCVKIPKNYWESSKTNGIIEWTKSIS